MDIEQLKKQRTEMTAIPYVSAFADRHVSTVILRPGASVEIAKSRAELKRIRQEQQRQREEWKARKKLLHERKMRNPVPPPLVTHIQKKKKKRKKKEKPQSFKKCLQRLGYKNYQNYLSGRLWLAIRKRVFAVSNKCVRCQKSATQVHHSRYDFDTMNGTTLQHLHPVCSECHEEASVVNGKKRKLNEANEFLGLR